MMLPWQPISILCQCSAKAGYWLCTVCVMALCVSRHALALPSINYVLATTEAATSRLRLPCEIDSCQTIIVHMLIPLSYWINRFVSIHADREYDLRCSRCLRH